MFNLRQILQHHHHNNNNNKTLEVGERAGGRARNVTDNLYVCAGLFKAGLR